MSRPAKQQRISVWSACAVPAIIRATLGLIPKAEKGSSPSVHCREMTIRCHQDTQIKALTKFVVPTIYHQDLAV
jgi:hypothetical protein